MIQNEEIFIEVEGIGFTFLIDKGMKDNFISPALLAFFNLGEQQVYSFPENEIREVNTNPENDNPFSFLPDNQYIINFIDVFHYIGKRIVRCRDNKLRVCKVFRLEFKYEGCTFSFPFLLDKSLNKPAILGRDSFNLIIKSVMKQKQKT